MSDKGRILTFPYMPGIETEAAAWVARFDAGDVSAKDQAAFQEWLNRSPLHREAIAEYGNLWSEFDTLRLLFEGDDSGRQPAMRDGQPAPLKKAGPWLAAAAAVIAVAGGMMFVHLESFGLAKFGSRSPANAMAAARPKAVHLAKSGNNLSAGLFYETPVGGTKMVVLPDGSSAILNTNSRLDVDFSGNRRDVHLVRGEVYFDVVHDKARPFTVHADNYVVHDIGTAFDVHISNPGLVEVGVAKGNVEVKPVDGDHVSPAVKNLGVLAAGRLILLSQKVERDETLSSAELKRMLAWQQGQLIYTGQPLGEVLSDISRYSDIKIELTDPALVKLPVGGAFRINQIAAIFAALENNFAVHAVWIDPRHVRFTSRRETSASRN